MKVLGQVKGQRDAVGWSPSEWQGHPHRVRSLPAPGEDKALECADAAWKETFANVHLHRPSASLLSRLVSNPDNLVPLQRLPSPYTTLTMGIVEKVIYAALHIFKPS